MRWLTVPSWPPFYAVDDADVPARGCRAHRGQARQPTLMGGSACWPAGERKRKIAFDVPPQAFTPPPKVTSSVVHLVPRTNLLPADVNKLGRVTEAAFGQRRKMLRQSLKSLGGERLLEAVGIDATRRAETLTSRSSSGWRMRCDASARSAGVVHGLRQRPSAESGFKRRTEKPNSRFSSSRPDTKSNSPGRRSRRRRSLVTIARTSPKARSRSSLTTT